MISRYFWFSQWFCARHCFKETSIYDVSIYLMNLQKSMSRWPATCLHPICPFPKGQQVKQKHCIAFCYKGEDSFQHSAVSWRGFFLTDFLDETKPKQGKHCTWEPFTDNEGYVSLLEKKRKLSREGERDKDRKRKTGTEPPESQGALLASN